MDDRVRLPVGKEVCDEDASEGESDSDGGQPEESGAEGGADVDDVGQAVDGGGLEVMLHGLSRRVNPSHGV